MKPILAILLLSIMFHAALAGEVQFRYEKITGINPYFSALRSGHRALQRPSLGNAISSDHPIQIFKSTTKKHSRITLFGVQLFGWGLGDMDALVNRFPFGASSGLWAGRPISEAVSEKCEDVEPVRACKLRRTLPNNLQLSIPPP